VNARSGEGQGHVAFGPWLKERLADLLEPAVDLGHDPEVAQLVERLPVQRRDAGSSPALGVQDAEGPP
jgi:hypothetical protein